MSVCVCVGGQGRIQEFHWGAQNMCTNTCMHITCAKHEVPFGKGPGSSRFFYDLSCMHACYLSLIFKHFEITFDQFFFFFFFWGGGVTPPLDPPRGGGGGMNLKTYYLHVPKPPHDTTYTCCKALNRPRPI